MIVGLDHCHWIVGLDRWSGSLDCITGLNQYDRINMTGRLEWIIVIGLLDWYIVIVVWIVSLSLDCWIESLKWINTIGLVCLEDYIGAL